VRPRGPNVPFKDFICILMFDMSAGVTSGTAASRITICACEGGEHFHPPGA
jgi:hypothetical protein